MKKQDIVLLVPSRHITVKEYMGSEKIVESVRFCKGLAMVYPRMIMVIEKEIGNVQDNHGQGQGIAALMTI